MIPIVGEMKMEEDSAIAETCVELSRRLGINYSDPKLQWGKDPIREDQLAFIFRGHVGLNDKLRGKLSVDEWRPLLASALVCDAVLRRKRRIIRLTYFGSALLIFLAFLWYLIVIIGPSFPARPASCLRCSYAGVAPVFLFADLIILALVFSPFIRRLVLEADLIASQRLGIHDDLLRVLAKVEEYSIGRQSGKFWKRYLAIPTVQERVRNLSDHQPRQIDS